MIEGLPSRTAERMAVERAAHQVVDAPLVLVDPLAIRMVAPDEAALLRQRSHSDVHSAITNPMRAAVVVRSRIAEDEMASAAARGVRQYVLLGAGLDTFAYRNPHPGVQVFEVDQPSTQRLKQERLAAAGISIPATVTFVPCDFARQSLPAVLDAAGFDRTRPAVVAWLGVVMYLERKDVLDTLRFVASLAGDTVLIFDYALPPAAVPWLIRLFYRALLKRLAAQGEPWISFFEPDQLRADLAGAGFTTIEDLDAGTINRRYLDNRSDGLRVRGASRIVKARR